MNGSIARVAVAPDVYGRIRSLLHREQFEVLHLHEPLASSLPLTVLHSANASDAVHIGTFHAFARRGLTSTSEWAYTSAKPFVGRYFRRLQGRIAVSVPARDFVSHFFPGDYRIIPNGVDVERFRPGMAPIAEYMDGKLNILYLGRIERRKGAKYLLRAIPHIREHYPNTRFIIAGDGQLRSAFEKLVAQAGLRDVVFTGRVRPEQMPAMYATAHVFCAPNTGGESQGMVLLEALASGRPVVASDIAGFRTVIRDRVDGILVPPRKHEELAWAICNLLGDVAARERLGTMGRLRAEEFSWERIGGRIEAYYHEMLGQRDAVVKKQRLLAPL
jgi:phosphatidylinositol alpha-mannosyltransferase